ncbi:hypothetical protein [Guptibacillus hwajinpoensis]|uniref:DUF3955 domain-containing protein n=1 Tax=Guptibacillus hwajinpoensis TaxID=208199 RepID=A0ABU0K2Z6_9BACL|nr:hypothetical protein [Alkalihalobacillus hemicentroti]MDQ0483696.1 hypothetical protein [Alkalihalobacillus hemicentroti]
MFKKVLLGLLIFFVVSGILLFVGNMFQLEILMFQFYTETSDGFEAGGSLIPFGIAAVVTYLVGRWCEKRKKVILEK